MASTPSPPSFLVVCVAINNKLPFTRFVRITEDNKADLEKFKKCNQAEIFAHSNETAMQSKVRQLVCETDSNETSWLDRQATSPSDLNYPIRIHQVVNFTIHTNYS